MFCCLPWRRHAHQEQQKQQKQALIPRTVESNKKVPYDNFCSICHNEPIGKGKPGNIVLLFCSIQKAHLVCSPCFDVLLKTENPSCPQCRAPITHGSRQAYIVKG